MHSLKIRASSWRTQIFKAIEIVEGHSAHQQNQISKVRNTNSAYLTTFLSTMPTDLNVISGSCISNLTGWKFTSFLRFHFLSTPWFLLWLKTCHFIWFTRAWSPTCTKKKICYAFERMSTSKILKIKEWKKVSFLCISKCEDSNDGTVVEHLLLLNFHIGYFSIVTPSLGCLTLRFFWQGVIVTLHFLSTPLFSLWLKTCRF